MTQCHATLHIWDNIIIQTLIHTNGNILINVGQFPYHQNYFRPVNVDSGYTTPTNCDNNNGNKNLPILMTNTQSKQSPSTNSTASSSVSSKLERTKLSCTGTLQKVKRVYLWTKTPVEWWYEFIICDRAYQEKVKSWKKAAATIIREVNLEAAFFLSTIPSSTTTMQCSEQHEYTSYKRKHCLWRLC